MIHVYIDNEFDAVRMQGRYLQQVIAIGAWLCDDAYARVDSFYSLVRPAGFYRLTPHVRRMTHLKDAQIQRASLFPQVADRFIEWLQAHAGGEEIRLSGKEFALLRYMVQNEGIVLSRDRLEQHLWNFDYAGGSNVIDVYIRYLRKKVDEGYEQKLIHTVRGHGYVIRQEKP